MKRRKCAIVIIGIIFVIISIYRIFLCFKFNIEKKNCEKIYANKIIKLPDKKYAKNGFTCTGLFWCEDENDFLVGNVGKKHYKDEGFKATIEIVKEDFSEIKGTIPCYSMFAGMRDIQGICKAEDESIWLCSCGEDRVRHIDKDFYEIENFYLPQPSGIAIDNEKRMLWILNNKYLYNCTFDGKIIKKEKIHIKGQDQLFFDKKNNYLYFSAGSNYYGDSYIYRIDLMTDKMELLYVLKDSYAIEGISIVNDVLYVLNDGYYHDSKIPVNQVNLYYLNDLKYYP